VLNINIRMAKNTKEIYAKLRKAYPDAKCALVHKNTWQLLVATILSAQCTDVRVNKVTRELFAKFPDVEAFARLPLEKLKKYIFSTGFYNNKAKNIKAAAEKIIKEYHSKVPDNMQDLLTIPGVARKTANVILSVWFHKNAGIVVDTHVLRLTERLGLTLEKDPKKVEQELLKLYPQAQWERLATMLIIHGREICHAKKPHCQGCFLNKICPSAFKV